jgi:hypothetical protein
MTRITILDPTAPPPEVDPHPGPSLSAQTLANGQIGIRYDLTWRSFDWVRDEWSRMLTDEGARVAAWCAGDRTGEAAATTLSGLQTFLQDQDVLISGLGN